MKLLPANRHPLSLAVRRPPYARCRGATLGVPKVQIGVQGKGHLIANAKKASNCGNQRSRLHVGTGIARSFHAYDLITRQCIRSAIRLPKLPPCCCKCTVEDINDITYFFSGRPAFSPSQMAL